MEVIKNNDGTVTIKNMPEEILGAINTILPSLKDGFVDAFDEYYYDGFPEFSINKESVEALDKIEWKIE